MTLNPRQEAFAKAYIETGNASEAYRRVYPRSKRWKKKTVWEKASRLMGKVRARVNELQGKAAEAHQVTVETIAAQLDEDREFARKCKNPGAAVSATMGLAKLYGLITDKSQVDQTTRYVALLPEESASEEEWLEQYAPKPTVQ